MYFLRHVCECVCVMCVLCDYFLIIGSFGVLSLQAGSGRCQLGSGEPINISLCCIILSQRTIIIFSPYLLQQENPMYVSPQTQYSNITYRPKTKTDSIQKEKE